MVFTNKTIQNLSNIYLNADSLEWVNNIKCIGVLIVNNLSFNLQINNINNKLSRIMIFYTDYKEGGTVLFIMQAPLWHPREGRRQLLLAEKGFS